MFSIKSTQGLGAVLLALLLVSCGQQSEVTQPMETGVTGADIIAADDHPDAWLSHGRNYAEDRFSPLAQVTSDNVSDLGLAWSFDLGTSRGVEVTPIVHDGVMYVTGTWNIVHALDARTGEELWRYDPEVDRSRAAYMCCDVVNRGVAIWGNKIFTGTIDGRLIAIDALTGEEVWDVLTVDLERPYSITGAPRIVKGKVIIGNGGAELGVRGYVTAYDAETGEQAWRFYTVPGNPDDGFETALMEEISSTWTGQWWVEGGGGTVWDSMAYDPGLDLFYIGVGNGSPWNHRRRSPEGGDNLFLSSIVALRPDTGEYVWHYQTTPAETWDYTATQHMILADLDIAGETRRVIMQAPKNGFFYVLDAATGELLSAENFVPVNWATHIDMETGRPVEVEGARWNSDQPFIQLPGPLGAHNWHPMSYSHDTGLVYIPAQEAPWAYIDDPDYEYQAGVWNTGGDFFINALPSDAAMFKAVKSMMKGRLLAWDPVNQKQVWAVEHGGPWNGGVLSTAGGLVFQGTADAHFAAYDAVTGDEKWKFFTQTGIVAAPITYSLDGEQYVTVAAGWGGSFVLGYGGVFPTGSQAKVGKILTFKLGEEGALEPLEVAQSVNSVPTLITDDPAVISEGFLAYGTYCSVCHGDHAYSSGLVPNLRYSSITTDETAWRSVVLGGALANAGMPNFSDYLSQEEAESIRAYVIAEANSDRTAAFYEEAGKVD
ncbi:MAG: PQQ-dependent dehydrogenase, methanol/ethanol family [Aquisalinus sp.]|nr:PQQ-dependent dehydrogenase, methanol/ethanol family [Aquisalinus sp.]